MPELSLWCIMLTAPVFGFGLFLGPVTVRAIMSVETPSNKQGIYTNQLFYTTYRVLLNVYDHNCIVILFKHLIYLFCRRTLRRFGGNTDRFYLFRSHGFQCNLQEYCPNQQKNFSDCHHRITYCRFDIVSVSMIKQYYCTKTS